MTTRVFTRFNNSGVTMAEYVLIGTSVLLVCLAACMGLSKSLQSRLLGLKGDMAQHAQQAQTVQMEVAQAQSNSDAQTLQNPDNMSIYMKSLWTSPSNPNAVCTQDNCINAADLGGASVSTAGSNGNTSVIDRMAGIYSRVAQILAAQGADPKTIDLLTQLASTGHTIADMQDWLNYDGSRKPNRPKSQVTATNRYINSELSTLRTSLANFSQLSTQLSATINDYPPEVRSLLTDASQVVLDAGGDYSAWQTKNKAGQRVLKFKSNPNNVAVIHTNSNTICDNGGDQSQCDVKGD